MSVTLSDVMAIWFGIERASCARNELQRASNELQRSGSKRKS